MGVLGVLGVREGGALPGGDAGAGTQWRREEELHAGLGEEHPDGGSSPGRG